METILKLIEAGWSVSFEPQRIRDNFGNWKIIDNAVMIRLRNRDYAIDHLLDYWQMENVPAVLDLELQLLIKENEIKLDKEEWT